MGDIYSMHGGKTKCTEQFGWKTLCRDLPGDQLHNVAL